MTSKNIISKAIIFICGVIFGFALTIFFGYLVSKNSFTTLPLDHLIRFGNIKIYALNSDSDKGTANTLMMTKDNENFFYAELDVNNKVNNVAIVSARNDIRFSLTTSAETGAWENAMYSYDVNNKTIGDEYIDADFDGRFDVKQVFDSNGNKKTIFIPLNKQWVEANWVKHRKACVDGQLYVYKDNYWTIEKDDIQK